MLIYTINKIISVELQCHILIGGPCSFENFSGFQLQDKHNASSKFLNIILDGVISSGYKGNESL